MEPTAEQELRAAMAAALDLRPYASVGGPATLDSAYPVSDLAAAVIATAADALVELQAALGHPPAAPTVSRPLADAWFGLVVSGVGWSPPPPWDAVAGDYATRDGWIRLHTNAPHHRAAALKVLNSPAEREEVAAAVARWNAGELEAAVVGAGGCAAELRTPVQWAAHPQGRAVAGLPLVERTATPAASTTSAWDPRPDRPLAGLRVLDLTRVLAGPAATRLLAGLGADVLRVDPPWWSEPALEPEMTLGKRTARLDARTPAGHRQLVDLLTRADVLVHGYRGAALAGLDLGPEERSALRPGLVDVSLTAYGRLGPWSDRRGFDSLVQMSCGVAAAGLVDGTAERPTPLPVQALDHATGYLMAAAVLAGLTRRVRDGGGSRAVLSLARTAFELERVRHLPRQPVAPPAPVESVSLGTAWGPARLLVPPIDGIPLRWDREPAPLGSDEPAW